MKTRAALWLMLLGPFFFASYGFANWVTSQRQNVPSIAFRWEHSIPFLAWTIVPYWSTDLLYVASLFICRTRHELDTHAKRLLSVQLFSVIVFLLFPLRFSFPRPAVTGVFGAMFAALFKSLMAFDKPFNQAPSLHLGIGAILWVRYSVHLNGVPRVLMQAWLILAGVSTLTTYQHHFIDGPAGIFVGLMAIGLFPMGPNAARRLSAVYMVGALLCGVAAIRPGPLNRLLLWPACSLLVPAAAYATRRPALFGKRNPAMMMLLAPYLAGAWINSRLRRKPGLQQVAADIWIGRAAGRSAYARRGFRSAVDVTAEFPARPSGSHYRSVPMLDLIPPTPAQLRQGAKAIEELQAFRPTVVYCALGYSRSAAVIATWLVRSGQAASAGEAIGFIRKCRPQAVLSHQHESAIEEASHGV